MVKGLYLNVLVEDSTSVNRPELRAQYGLSFLLELDLSRSERMKVLFDAGPSSDVILHNLENLKIDPNDIDLVVLSHGHYDHTGGLLAVLRRVKKRIILVAHPSVFDPKLKIEPYLKYIGPPYNIQELEDTGAVLLLSEKALQLAKDVWASGEVERTTEFEKVKGFYTVKEHRFVEDGLLDDQAIVAHIDGKGLVVISGCAHSGIINTVRYAQKLSGVERIYAIMGGFHLQAADEERVEATIKELEKLKPELVAPCHCTGFKAIKRLSELFKDRCKPLRSGDVIEV